jgi:ADP-ribosylglycohydrolase
MVGGILGDIIGSRFEFSRPQNFNFNTVKLFESDCFFTDDTVMLIATKYTVLHNCSYSKVYQKFGRLYKNVGYGAMFKSWLISDYPVPYKSYGNGSAMRVGFIGEYYNTLDDVLHQAEESAKCTHNHPEGIRGAKAVAACVYLAKNGASKKEISSFISNKFDYKLNRSLNTIRIFSKFDLSCRVSVPLAIRCFLESDDFESCMRNVLSIRCDTDTIASISGIIAENFYKVTGFNNKKLLKQYLIKRDNILSKDTYLYDIAIQKY